MTDDFEKGVQFLMTYANVTRQRAIDVMTNEQKRKSIIETMAMSDEEAAEAWRLKQAQKILDVVRTEHRQACAEHR